MSQLAAVRGRLAALRELRPAPLDGFSQQVRDVIVVASSSRGGSSVFTEMLRHAPTLCHFRAEVNPFLVLAGLGFPESGDSDALGTTAAGDRVLLDAELALDAGGWAPLGARGARAYGLDLAWRLTAQWPALPIDPEQVVTWVLETLEVCSPVDLTGFHLALLRRVRAAHPEVTPWFYDLDPERIQLAFPGLVPPSGAPGPVVLEEPPFVLARPWQTATAEDLAARPLVIKTPSNVYRLPFLRALFPAARFRVLHLTRNPAASINGLVDGWRYRGFHSHRVGDLRIAGHGDPDWWNYDLPPGWRYWTDQPLEQVCGFQWRSAHRAVLDFLGAERPESLRVRFEDVVGDRAARRRAWADIAAWLGVDLGPAVADIVEHGLPPVMATHAPRRRRWFAKATALEPVLARQDTRELAERLGYRDPESWV